MALDKLECSSQAQPGIRCPPGVIRLLGPIRPWQPVRHDNVVQSLPWFPLSGRGDPACGLALPLLQPQPA